MTATKEKTWDQRAEELGRDAMESIAEMVAALQCDYDRLEELREMKADWSSDDRADGKTWEESGWAEELAELEAAAGDCESEEEARERIHEDPLSLQFRSDWCSSREGMEPAEFELLLGTGGPAVRIIGDINRGSPSRPRLQVQDWFQPWTEYLDADEDILQAYCEVFYFDA